jgi:putative ABC transport system permease protein
MFRHFLLMTARSFARHKLYGIINIAGLSVGLACAILIALFVRDEISYDKWIPDSEHLYRVEVSFHLPGRAPMRLAQTPLPAPRAMRENIPEVKAMTRMSPGAVTVTVGDRQYPETLVLADPNFLQVIKLPLVVGDPAHALEQPASVVISERIARKYFGATNPLGKLMSFRWSDGPKVQSFAVTGVARDLPHNTQLVADFIAPITSQTTGYSLAVRERQWTAADNTYGYVELTPGADPERVVARLAPIVDRSIDLKAQGMNLRGSELEQFHLTRFWDAHLTSDQFGGMKPPGSWTLVYGFAFIALLILLVACFNFMNLATARASLRAKEIALRKVGGAKRRQLLAQFLGEAVLMALSALVIALAMVEVLAPVYGRFLDQPIALHYVADWKLLLMVIGGAILVGLLGGLYPALVLSSFRPVTALKMSAAAQTGSGWIRMVLVVFQFTVSIALGVAALVVFAQINFARSVDLQFRREGIVVVGGIRQLTKSERESFARMVSTHPQVASTALSNGVPFDFFPVDNPPVRKPGDRQSFGARMVCITPEYPSLYDMPLLSGRFLAREYGEDTTGRNVLVNALTAGQLGYSPQEAPGKTISIRGSSVTIVGVVADSKVDGLRTRAPATVLSGCEDRLSYLSVRLRHGAPGDALSFIDKTWHSLAPSAVIQRYFVSDAFGKQFQADEKQGVMFGVFVGIAIFIACLGLFGLAVFTAARRTKEIGVRKVFGARPRHIVRLLLQQVSKPVLIANVIAWPLAYLYLRHWIEGYEDRISLSPLYFLCAGGLALLIACATVFAHALRLARGSPVHALRYE